jgi:hypothetical protein
MLPGDLLLSEPPLQQVSRNAAGVLTAKRWRLPCSALKLVPLLVLVLATVV